MIKRIPLYTKPDGNRESRLIYIFAEGKYKETNYFNFFNSLASQIHLHIVEIEDGKNSPMGLYENACNFFFPKEENNSSTPELRTDDQVWFVIDTDKWGKKINELRTNVKQHQNWLVAQSNPCFEVWLYYHFFDQKPKEQIFNWKDYLDKTKKGGFDPRKHPTLIETATINSEKNYSENSDMQPDNGTTEMHLLAKSIIPLILQKLREKK